MPHRLLPTRRDVLCAGLAGVAGWALAQRSAPAPGAETKSGWIDAHSHIWTREIDKFPLADGQTLDDLAPPSFTSEELLDVARPEGVERVVLIQHHIYHGWDNSYLIDAAARYPARFRVVGMVDDLADRPDARMRELLKQRVTAFRITSRIRGKQQWLEGPGMAAMWKCAAETRQPMCCLIDPDDLPAVERMCRRNPETPVVIDHFARIGVDGTIRESDLKRLCNLARFPTTVKVSAFYALGQKEPPYADLVPMIRRLYETFGPERLMWASDCPYQLDGAHTYAASIGLVRDRLDFLSDADKEWLLRKTAERVFFFA